VGGVKGRVRGGIRRRNLSIAIVYRGGGGFSQRLSRGMAIEVEEEKGWR
jgi:hypothetical protein